MPAVSSHSIGLINSIMKNLNHGGALTKKHQEEELRSSPRQPAAMQCGLPPHKEEGLVTALRKVVRKWGMEVTRWALVHDEG